MNTTATALLFCLLMLAGTDTGLSNEQNSTQQVKYNPTFKNLGAAKEYEGELKSLSAVNIRNAKLQLITDELLRPWAMEFIDNDRLIITEIGGQMKILNLADQTMSEVTGVPAVLTNNYQIGMLDVEVHPQFAKNRKIYFSYSKHDPQADTYYSLAVASATLKDNRLEEVTTLFADNPYSWSPSNFGGALEFDQHGLLYIATGDRSDGLSAQNMNILQGKILRLNDDGTPAADNPYINDPNIDDRIYASGVRNPQGLHHDATYDLLFEAEHGPMGGDEVNIIRSGADYGWPTITYGLSYTTKPIGEGTHKTGLTQPLFYYLPSEAISPLTVYRGDMFHEWQGDILVGALKGRQVSKLDYDDGHIRSEYPILTEIADRIRDIKVAPDGSILILSHKGQLNRLYREGEQYVPTEDPTDGATVYQMACAGCHDAGAYDAPVLGDKARWSVIADKPLSVIYMNTIQGKNAMPARGTCAICSDDHLRKAVDYMLKEAQ